MCRCGIGHAVARVSPQPPKQTTCAHAAHELVLALGTRESVKTAEAESEGMSGGAVYDEDGGWGGSGFRRGGGVS